jgi:type I restriction enzyme S subunit
MSKIDELLAELCSKGVPRSSIGELCKVETGKRDANEGSDDGQYHFFTTAKKTGRIDTYRWDCDALLIAGNANIGNVKQYNGKFDAYQRTYVLSGFRPDVDVRYLYFALSDTLNFYLDANKNVAAMTYIVLKTLVDFEVPVPSLEVQHEIVSILDKFTQLEAELEAELDARRSQYEHTRDQLLDFSGDLSSHPLRELIAELCPEGVQFYKMADVLQRKKGAPVTAQSMKSLPKGDGSVRVFAGGRTLVDVDSGALAENLVISGPGIIVKSRGIIEFAFWEGLFSHKNELWSYVAKSRKLDLKFAYFYLLTKTEEFRSLARSKSVKMPQLATPDTDEYRIPIPPLEVQHEIVSILDKLDALVNDLTFGLPAEITARRKQYEYYRNQLLTFKELETA